MKIGKYPVKHSYKLARMLSDLMSLVVAYVIFSATFNFFAQYKQAINRIGNKNLDFVRQHGYSLAYRQYFVWIFPLLVAAVFAVYLVLVLKNHKFAKYRVTKQNAQAVYDWYAFAVSLCKLPLLLSVFDIMYIVHQRLMFNNVSAFSLLTVICAFMIVIIIRLSFHRISILTEPREPDKPEDTGGVKARLVDEDEKDD